MINIKDSYKISFSFSTQRNKRKTVKYRLGKGKSCKIGCKDFRLKNLNRNLKIKWKKSLSNILDENNIF